MFADYNPECERCGHTARYCECGEYHAPAARPTVKRAKLAKPDAAPAKPYLVERYAMIGCDWVIYAAHAPITGPGGDYSTIMHHAGQWYGEVASRRLPAELDALPAMTDSRMAAVRAFTAAYVGLEHALILAAYPDAASGRFTDAGEVYSDHAKSGHVRDGGTVRRYVTLAQLARSQPGPYCPPATVATYTDAPDA